MSAILNEQIAPEIVQAIVVQATAHGVSVNDYLRQILGLNGQMQELALAPDNDTQNERPFYETATPQELAAKITQWMDSHDPNTPALPLEAVSKESIYPDR
jgi:hypothetical protein